MSTDDADLCEALRETYWERAGIEGLDLAAFVDESLAQVPDAAALGRLARLVDEVCDTALLNLAAKAQEEGGVYEALAEERAAEIQEERGRLGDRLREALAAGGATET